MTKPIRRKKKSKIKSNERRLRLSVCRSILHIYAQIIDDKEGKTMVSASSLKLNEKNKIKAAEKVGQLIAEAALKLNIKDVIFDRGNFIYHGRIKALAEATRKAGLTI